MIVKCTQIHILLKAQKAGNATNLLSQNEQIGKCYDKEKVSTSLFQDSSTVHTKSRLKAYLLTPFRDSFRDTILLLTFISGSVGLPSISELASSFGVVSWGLSCGSGVWTPS